MTEPPRAIWWGGIAAALASWGFAGYDLAAHHGLDPLSAILVGIGGVFVAIPRIDRLSASIPILGRSGVSVAVNEVVRAASESAMLAGAVGANAEAGARLYASWLQELDALAASAPGGGDDPAEYARRVMRFVNTRLEDLSGWVGGAGEDVRAALWWWSDADGGARILAAPRIRDPETLAHVFTPGSGLLGRLLADGETINVADAPAEAGWQRVATEAPRYRGLLCIPIVVRGRVAGALTVDRGRRAEFDETSVQFARQIATLVKLVARGPRGEGFSLPLPAASASWPPASGSPRAAG